MSDTYRYTSLIRSAEYQLTEEGVAVVLRNFLRYSRSVFPYDRIPIRSSMISWSSKPLLWATIICCFLSVVMLLDLFFGSDPEPGAAFFYGGLATLFYLAFLTTRTTAELFGIEDDQLQILRRRSEDSKLLAFTKKLQEFKQAFLKQKLSRRAKELPLEENTRYLLYLREADVINDEGYAQLRSFLDSIYSTGENMGFHTRS